MYFREGRVKHNHVTTQKVGGKGLKYIFHSVFPAFKTKLTAKSIWTPDHYIHISATNILFQNNVQEYVVAS